MIAAVRSARTVMPMSSKEAGVFGIEEKRRNWFVRIDSAKSNVHPPQEKANWCERISVDLDNGDLAPVDSIGGLMRWSPPDPFDDLSHQAIKDALSEQIGLRRSWVVRSLSGCKIPSVISTVRPR